MEFIQVEHGYGVCNASSSSYHVQVSAFPYSNPGADMMKCSLLSHFSTEEGHELVAFTMMVVVLGAGVLLVWAPPLLLPPVPPVPGPYWYKM